MPPGVVAESVPEASGEAVAAAEPKPVVVPAPEAKPEPRPEPKPEATPAKPPKPEVKPEAKPEAKPADSARAQALLEGKPAAADGRFVVQVGAFAEMAAAREARQKVEKLGSRLYAGDRTSAGKRIRVRVGLSARAKS